MRKTHSVHISVVLGAAVALAGCQDSVGGPLALAEGPPDAGCIRLQEPNSYDIFFVIDVSGSMGPFLTDLRNQLVTFADSFPRVDSIGRQVRLQYRVIAFVNDWRFYGGDPTESPMTSVIALQAAFDDAIAEGADNYNLTRRTFNAETEENLLDALAQATMLETNSEATLVMLATDAPFKENPEVLASNITIQASYAQVLESLRTRNARVHAFTASAIDGITRPFKKQEPLTSLPGSTINQLQDLAGANDRIRDTLAFIARESSCN